MAYTTIDKPTDYFNTVTYTGNGGTQSITGVGFTQDFTWIKIRSETNHHRLLDTVRGATKELYSDLTSAEVTGANGLTSFNSDGFTLGTDHGFNKSSATYVSWNWLAGGTASSNSDGSITSSVSANTTAGFSIVSYTGTGSNATIGHGLGAVPKMFIARNITDTEQWTTYHVGLDTTAPQNYHVRLNTTDARVDEASVWNNTAPTSSVFSVGSSGAPNGSGDNHIAYCFAEKKGYSKFGSYTGNGNADGTFVYTGFKPAWFMQKRIDVANGWHIFDTKRDTFNACERYMTANASSSEPSGTDYVDILSNGLKMRRNGNDINGSGASYIYMAFAESPFVTSTGIPTTAR